MASVYHHEFTKTMIMLLMYSPWDRTHSVKIMLQYVSVVRKETSVKQV